MSLPTHVRVIAAAIALLAVGWAVTSVDSSLSPDADAGVPANTTAAAGTYGAGSNLAASNNLCAADNDNDGEGELEGGHLAYLTHDACIPNRTVRPGDLRLTTFTNRTGGQFVDDTHEDARERDEIGPVENARLLVLDENDDGQFSRGEPIYLAQAPADEPLGKGARVDSLRLSNGPGAAGTYVDADDPDTETNATLVETNGRLLLSSDGQVYLRLTDETKASVQPGDLRLSNTEAGAIGTYVAGAAPIEAGAQAFVGLVVATLTGWVAVFPERTDRAFREAWDVDLSDTGSFIGVLAHLVFAAIVFGGTLLSTASGLSQLRRTGRHPAESSVLSSEAIVFSLVISLILFVLAALTWLTLVRDKSLAQSFRDLRLDLIDLPIGIVAGIVTTLGVLVVLGGVNLALQELGVQPSNPQAAAITDALSPISAIAVALLAGMGEEVYFRGFLLPRTGNLVQGVLFGLIHASYLTPMQVLLPMAFGLLLGWVTRKTSLWAAITSHATFNGVMLLGSMYREELSMLVQAVL